VSSESKGSNKGIQSDASWIRQIGRWLFSEIYILLEFYINPASRIEFGDILYKFIHLDSLKYNFHLALGGAQLFSESCSSILASYETNASYAPSGSQFQARIIAPPLSRDITPKTRKMLKDDYAARINKTAPASRKKERVIPRQENSYINAISVVDTSIVVEDDRAVSTASFMRDVTDTSKRQEFLIIYYGMICMIFNRLSGKSDSMRGSVGEIGKKKSMADPDVDTAMKELKRSQGLFQMERILVVNGKFFRPTMLQFSKEALKKKPRTLLSIYETKDPKISGMCELLVYWRVAKEDDTVSSSGTLSEYFIPCQSGKGDGSISIKSFIKGTVLFDFFIDKVCLSF
jgi:hypothetical protein